MACYPALSSRIPVLLQHGSGPEHTAALIKAKIKELPELIELNSSLMQDMQALILRNPTITCSSGWLASFAAGPSIHWMSSKAGVESFASTPDE